jgi:hypothetical protein
MGRDEQLSHLPRKITAHGPHADAAFNAEKMAPHFFIGENLKPLQVFEPHGKNLVIGAPFQTVPPERCRFFVDHFVAIGNIGLFFVPVNPVFMAVFPAYIHVSEIPLPFTPGIAKKHGAHVFHQRRLAAFVLAMHDNQAFFRRRPGYIMINTEII